MKIIFQDGYSIFKRPDVEKEFNSTEELFSLLQEFGNFKYAYSATICCESIRIPIFITEDGGWKLG